MKTQSLHQREKKESIFMFGGCIKTEKVGFSQMVNRQLQMSMAPQKRQKHVKTVRNRVVRTGKKSKVYSNQVNTESKKKDNLKIVGKLCGTFTCPCATPSDSAVVLRLADFIPQCKTLGPVFFIFLT